MVWGIALSGGGVPGVAAHLGFLSVLEEQNLLPPVLVGASAGGIAAGMLAAGVTAADAVKVWGDEARSWWRLIPQEAIHAAEFLRPKQEPGILNLYQFVLRVGTAVDAVESVSRWKIGYGAVVSDLNAGKPLLVHAGTALDLSTEEVLAATAALPPIFSGIRTEGGHLLCDGGLFDDSPVDAARALGAEKVVLVHIGGPVDVPDRLNVGELTRLVLSRGLAWGDRGANPIPPDLRVDVPAVGGLLSFADWDRDMEAGRSCATGALVEIRRLAGLSGGAA